MGGLLNKPLSWPRVRPRLRSREVFHAQIGNSPCGHAQSTPPASGARQFIPFGGNAILTSKLVGLNIQTAGCAGTIEGGEINGVVVSSKKSWGASHGTQP